MQYLIIFKNCNVIVADASKLKEYSVNKLLEYLTELCNIGSHEAVPTPYSPPP